MLTAFSRSICCSRFSLASAAFSSSTLLSCSASSSRNLSRIKLTQPSRCWSLVIKLVIAQGYIYMWEHWQERWFSCTAVLCPTASCVRSCRIKLYETLESKLFVWYLNGNQRRFEQENLVLEQQTIFFCLCATPIIMSWATLWSQEIVDSITSKEAPEYTHNVHLAMLCMKVW